MSSPSKQETGDIEPRPLSKPTFTKISNLNPLNSGFSVYVRVGAVSRKINREYLDGTVLRVFEAIVGDETGCMVLTVRDAIFDQVKEGDTLVLRNAKVEMYQNFMRLSVDRWGLIEKVSPEVVAKVDLTNNISKVEYELVSPRERRGTRGRGRRGRGRDEDQKRDN